MSTPRGPAQLAHLQETLCVPAQYSYTCCARMPSLAHCLRIVNNGFHRLKAPSPTPPGRGRRRWELASLDRNYLIPRCRSGYRCIRIIIGLPEKVRIQTKFRSHSQPKLAGRINNLLCCSQESHRSGRRCLRSRGAPFFSWSISFEELSLVYASTKNRL